MHCARNKPSDLGARRRGTGTTGACESAEQCRQVHRAGRGCPDRTLSIAQRPKTSSPSFRYGTPESESQKNDSIVCLSHLAKSMPPMTRSYGGTGLGLAICKKLGTADGRQNRRRKHAWHRQYVFVFHRGRAFPKNAKRPAVIRPLCCVVCAHWCWKTIRHVGSSYRAC